MRDITLEDTFYHHFTTRAFATGIPTQLAGTPALSVLEENNATPITAGVSVSVDRASVTGLNEATIVATAANGYESGKSYSIYISTGTVGGVSVVGEIVGQFTIAASAAAVDLANGTDGLGAIKAETAAILDDTDLIDDGTSGLAKIATDVAAILVDTADMQPKLGAPAADISADIAAIQSDTDNIQTRIPAALVGGRIDANMGAISGDATAADNLEEGATALVVSAVNDPGAAATTTSFVTDLTEATDSHYRGRSLTFTTGNLIGQSCIILGYNGTTKAVTVTPLTEAPADNDEFVIG